ncbi:MAG TPA: hypothetical protein VFP21_02015 [Solirubrobacterales bacterium]|nr:hypothetical protein [Solirubrobacterales bacterium]
MLVSAAAAETVVPPGNGAATQYTEAYPTSGGNAVNGDGINGGGGGHSNPSHVLGHHNAKKLEDEGQVGKEAARVAAETAPAQGTGSTSTGSGGGHHGTAPGGSGGQNGSGGGGNSGVHTQSLVQHTGGPAESGSGSSGLSEVIGQATGSSSGDSGLLLPLILLAALVGSLAYAWRRRRVAH